MLEKGEYGATVIMAFRNLETVIRDNMSGKGAIPMNFLVSLYTDNENIRRLLVKTKQYK